MAVSAFKSTTKRVCGLGVGNEPECASIAPFQPSTPFNKRNHRRTRSFSDFSSRSLSDSASVTVDANSIHLDSLFRQGRVSTRYQSDDSESDADSMYSRHTYRSRQIAELGASRKAALQHGTSKGTPAAQTDLLRRSSSCVDGRYKEIADFLSCLDDDPSDDADNVFTRPNSRGRRRADVQSDTESVFSRLTRPRQTAEAGPRRAAGAVQNGKANKGTRAGALRRSNSQANLLGSFRSRDDQSETDSSYSRPTYRSRQNADFGASRVAATPKKGTRQAALRRSSSQIDMSDSSSVGDCRQPLCHQDDSDSPEEVFYEMNLDVRTGDDDASNDHPEEVKTIRAVHTQNKEPGPPDLDAISLYDAMRVEMRKAVLEIKREIEQNSVTKELAVAAPSSPEGLRCFEPGDDADTESTVSEVRQEYAAKLEQSEKRAQDLWTQLAAEESRCIELVKFVKELLPPQPDSRPKPQVPPPTQVRPLMGPEVEKQLVSQCLDADAQRYFDECVSISGLDIMSVNDASSCGVGYQSESPAWSVKDMSFSPRKKDFGHTNEKKMAVLEPLMTFCAQVEQNGRCTGKSSNLFARSTVNDDGLVLPWLQWETDLDLSFQQQSVMDASMVISHTASSSSKALTRSSTWRGSKHLLKDKQEPQAMDFPPGVSGLGSLSNGDLSCWKNIEFGHLRNVDMDATSRREWHEGQFDVELFVLQRMWLRHRIKDGRILVCGGVRF